MRIGILLSIACFITIGTACPVGWTPYQDSCYHVSPENESWINAMKMCEVHGSYLADILDAEENRFIVSLMHHTQSNSFWIGGSDWTVEGKWVWEPLGIKFNYTNFADGRPNNYHGENCLSIRAQNHQWDDDDCDEKRRYLCEKRQAKLYF
uniref:C-type lectin domain-containing protein n=1 Tax=Magallana gigas TaxID=29159 RepID=A0A8W8HZ22_MAGGI